MRTSWRAGSPQRVSNARTCRPLVRRWSRADDVAASAPSVSADSSSYRPEGSVARSRCPCAWRRSLSKPARRGSCASQTIVRVSGCQVPWQRQADSSGAIIAPHPRRRRCRCLLAEHLCQPNDLLDCTPCTLHWKPFASLRMRGTP